jgi:mannitol operon transcriptional antiterminator
MAEESRALFSCFRAVTIERVLDGHSLPRRDPSAGLPPVPAAFAEDTARAVEEHFSFTLGAGERAFIAQNIALCRARGASPLEAGGAYIDGLTLRLVEAFDREQAPFFLANTELLAGLRAHLYPALNRIRRCVELPDPFDNDLRARQPELYEKTRRAVRVLEEELGLPVNGSELSFFAIHFYAALFKLGEKTTRKKVLRAGVVCVSGIGVSYMIASQIRKHFQNELTVHINSWDDREGWAEDDFLVSTAELAGAGKPVVVTGSVLTPEDYQTIREIITETAFVCAPPVAEPTPPADFARRLDGACRVMAAAKALITAFDVYTVDDAVDFDGLALFCAELFARASGADGAAGVIFDRLVRREKVSSQVIGALELVLLHTRDAVVRSPFWALVRPGAGVFSRGVLAGTRVCVLLLFPAVDSGAVEGAALTALAGTVSRALVESPDFLAAVKLGARDAVLGLLERELAAYVPELCADVLAAS